MPQTTFTAELKSCSIRYLHRESDMKWCFGDGNQLFVDYFNYDERADMLCHDQVHGTKYMSFATENGTFTNTSW